MRYSGQVLAGCALAMAGLSTSLADDETLIEDGHLRYHMVQAGSEWRWETRGVWTFDFPNWANDSARGVATISHETTDMSYEGVLIDVTEGHANTMAAGVQPLLEDGQITGYHLSFAPDPNLMGYVTLRFSEPSAMPQPTGQTNTLETNHPGVLALSYFFREYFDGGSAADLPMTPNGAESESPVSHTVTLPGGSGGEIILEWEWEWPQPD